VPRKIRELKADLRRAGFALLPRQGKGSHTKWKHPLLADPVLIAGHDGDDVQQYQERIVLGAIRDAREIQRRQPPS
jgi:predicted RNA binding protein YcfA (HicA-like mRNA interferase family)